MKFMIHATDRDYFVGYYLGLSGISPYEAKRFGSLGQAMLFVKSNLDRFYRESFGFTVFPDEMVREGNHYIQKTLLRWHRDGADCCGELVNPDIGWRICIDENNRVAEETKLTVTGK